MQKLEDPFVRTTSWCDPQSTGLSLLGGSRQPSSFQAGKLLAGAHLQTGLLLHQM